MELYKRLSRYYDEVFFADPKDLAFFLSLVRGKKRLLDIGCGTGNRTELFSNAENEIIGVDLDASMIDVAARKHGGDGLFYEVLDMRELGKRFSGRHFDAVLCLGNTLVHLTQNESAALLADIYALLAPEGLFILQILNYDRLMDNNVDRLPDIETGRVVFERHYAWTEQALRFIGVLKIKESGEELRAETTLHPLRLAELDAALRSAGFGRVRYYGGFAGEEHSADAFVTVALCVK